jgi:hypothetical protein
MLFVETPTKRGINAVTAQIAADAASTIKVKVNAPFRVVHEGVAYADGDVVEVPNDYEHQT